jgi:phenylalanyl-tRNA synthetase beta chain
MIISLNWLKKFTNIDLSVDELATLIGARLVEIEESVDLGQKYKDVLVVRVVEVNKIEGSDHLNLTKIDDGGVSNGIERDEDGLIQVVCGAPNIKSGQMVAWLPPNSIVPETFKSSEQFILGTRKLRGYISNGMIASSKELDLSDEHEGILEINADVKPGDSFADIFELNDILLDIANKSLTHRPDCFGIIGFAREVSAIQGNRFETPEMLRSGLGNIENNFNNEFKLNVTIDSPELSDRYSAVVMSGVDVNKKTPFQIQTYLSRVGVRPINAVVDVTNYLMMLTGQPLHAFDYDKLVALNDGKADIHVRAGRDKETLLLLDGRVIELTTSDIVISSGDVAIGLAGAMGGASTAIDKDTKNIIIESATFNLYNLRSTQMRHGIFSEAITRFTKGQPAELSAPVLIESIKLMGQWAGAECISRISETYPGKKHQPALNLEVSTINGILGSNFNIDDVSVTLRNVGFTVEQGDGNLVKVIAPYWRSDIHIVEDLIEEIGRLNGFDNINPSLPIRNFTAVRPSNFDSFRKEVRQKLVRAGSNEVLTYSFIHGNIIQKSGQKVENSYRITNSISPDLQYYRQTLTPSILDLVHPNIKQGYDGFALFELNKTHQKSDGLSDESVPVEVDSLALVVSNKKTLIGSPYYQAKRIFDYLCGSLGVEVVYRSIEGNLETPVYAPYEYRRSAEVLDKKTGKVIGVIGEYKKSVTKNFKLPQYAAGFEVNTRTFFDAFNVVVNNYRPLSRYPSAERDICFQVDLNVTYAEVMGLIDKALDGVGVEVLVSVVDIYQPVDMPTKNITVRVKLTSSVATLTGEEVTNQINSIAKFVSENIKATVI